MTTFARLPQENIRNNLCALLEADPSVVNIKVRAASIAAFATSLCIPRSPADTRSIHARAAKLSNSIAY